MRKASTIIMSIVALAGCTHADMTYLPDGRQGYAIQCNGKWNSNADCVKKAGEMCGARGYDIIGTDHESSGFLDAFANGGVGGLSAGTHTNRSMVIACKS